MADKEKKEKKEQKPRKPRTQKQFRDALVRKAYRTLGKKLEASETGEAINEIIKLLKAEKEFAGEETEAKEVTVRWDDSPKES